MSVSDDFRLDTWKEVLGLCKVKAGENLVVLTGETSHPQNIEAATRSALAMGAKACLLGRGYAYGMAAAGDAGVDRALEILKADLVRTMKLLGANSVKELNADLVALKSDFRVD